MTPPPGVAQTERRYEVTLLELFFDLVFVFAVSQLSRHLLEHLTWRGVAESVVMLLAIFAVWAYTSWAATLVRAERSPTRWMVLAVMLVGLFMNAAVTRAFGDTGWYFAVPLVATQIGRTLWTIAYSPDPYYRNHFVRVLLWLAVTAPVWLAGAAAEAEARLCCWTIAAGIDLVGTWLGHPVPGRWLRSENVPFDADHMLERCRLFLIIALGETVLTTGLAIAAAPVAAMTVVTGTAAFVGSVALWSLTFGRAHDQVRRHLAATRDPVRTGRFAVNAVMIMVAGLIAIAVANELVIVHPAGRASVPLSLLLGAGPILYLAAHGWYLWALPGTYLPAHAPAIAALALAAIAAPALPPYVALLLSSALLAAIAIVER